MKPTMKKTKNPRVQSPDKSAGVQKGTSKRVPTTKKVGKPLEKNREKILDKNREKILDKPKNLKSMYPDKLDHTSRAKDYRKTFGENDQKTNPAMSFREMLKLVIESGGQQKMDAKNPALLRWAQRVASNKYTEHSKQELYAGLLYERFGGEFSLYDSLNESVQRRRKLREGLNDQEIDRIRKLTADLHNRDISSQEFFKQINSMQAVPAAEEPPVPSTDDVDMSMASDFDSDFGTDDDIVDPEYDLGLDAELSNMDDLGDFDDLGDIDQPPPRATPFASY